MSIAMLSGSRYSHDAGAAGTVNVPAGVQVTSIACFGDAGGGTLTITPGGANQTGTAQTAIPIPESEWFQFPSHVLAFGQLGPGTVLEFASTISYVVTYARYGAGA